QPTAGATYDFPSEGALSLAPPVEADGTPGRSGPLRRVGVAGVRGLVAHAVATPHGTVRDRARPGPRIGATGSRPAGALPRPAAPPHPAGQGTRRRAGRILRPG